jgi:hypothetical protein
MEDAMDTDMARRVWRVRHAALADRERDLAALPRYCPGDELAGAEYLRWAAGLRAYRRQVAEDVEYLRERAAAARAAYEAIR